MGDFNVAPEDRDVYDPKAWAGSVLVSEPERAAFRALLDLGLKDSFPSLRATREDVLVVGLPGVCVRRNMGLRIDHILLSGELARSCRSSTIDREPRKREQPSDHAPAVAEIS
jgi:exodeoxyribonuclease-3